MILRPLVDASARRRRTGRRPPFTCLITHLCSASPHVTTPLHVLLLSMHSSAEIVANVSWISKHPHVPRLLRSSTLKLQSPAHAFPSHPHHPSHHTWRIMSHTTACKLVATGVRAAATPTLRSGAAAASARLVATRSFATSSSSQAPMLSARSAMAGPSTAAWRTSAAPVSRFNRVGASQGEWA